MSGYMGAEEGAKQGMYCTLNGLGRRPRRAHQIKAFSQSGLSAMRRAIDMAPLGGSFWCSLAFGVLRNGHPDTARREM